MECDLRDAERVARVCEDADLPTSLPWTPAEKVAGRVFNVACGERHTLNETFRVLADLFQFKEAPVFGPPRTGDIQDSLADISAAREAFEYQPKVSFEEGLYRTVAWYRKQYAGR